MPKLIFSYSVKKGQLQKITTPNGLDLNYTYDDLDFLTGVRVGDLYQMYYEFDELGQLIELRQTPAN